jgi:hypothetical protein
MAKWATALVTAAVLFAAWFLSDLAKCQDRTSAPTYSPDGKFYTQMQFTICENHAKSHGRLLMGTAGKPGEEVLLDMKADIGTVKLSWREGSELHIEVPESAIAKRYGPFGDDLPRIVVINP